MLMQGGTRSGKHLNIWKTAGANLKRYPIVVTVSLECGACWKIWEIASRGMRGGMNLFSVKGGKIVGSVAVINKMGNITRGETWGKRAAS